jgi:hypothetical protein
MDDYQKPDKLEGLEKKLYSTNSDIRQKPRHDFKPTEPEQIPVGWAKEAPQEFPKENLKLEKPKISFFTKIFITSLIFFIAALSYAFYIFVYKSGPDAENVNIKINAPVSIPTAQEFTFDILIENNNLLEMQEVYLTLEYPDGTRSGKDISIPVNRERYEIDNIGSGSFLRETKRVYLFGEEGDIKEIIVKISYTVTESTATFEKETSFNVLLKTSPVKINVSSVSELTSGQDIVFDVEIFSNSAKTLDNVLLKADYPFGFAFESSTLNPSTGNNIWYINKLEPTEAIKFTIKGKLQGQNNDDKLFKFNIGLKNEENPEEINVLFNSVLKNVVLVKPFLDIVLSVDENKSSVFYLNPNKRHDIKIDYKNNTKDVIRDVDVVLKIDGEIVRKDTIKPSNGFYRSIDNSVIWDKTTFPEFEQLEVGESGQLVLSVSSDTLIGSQKYINPEVSLSAKVEGLRYEDVDVPEKIVSEVFKKLRFNTVVVMDVKSLFYTSQIPNTGTLPPNVEETVTYTIKTSLANASNRISNGTLEMSLPNYVNFTNMIWPENADVKYDSRSRKVVWKIGEIVERTGFDSSSRSMEFQVSITPSLSQKGISPILVNQIVFTGNDMFTGNQITVKKENVSTSISDYRDYREGNVID